MGGMKNAKTIHEKPGFEEKAGLHPPALPRISSFCHPIFLSALFSFCAPGTPLFLLRFP
jgi:hypothetical protein